MLLAWLRDTGPEIRQGGTGRPPASVSACQLATRVLGSAEEGFVAPPLWLAAAQGITCCTDLQKRERDVAINNKIGTL